MTHKEFRRILGTLGISQVGFAKLLGIGDRSARRYAAGHTAIPEPIAKMLRLAATGIISVADIEMVSNVPSASRRYKGAASLEERITAKLMRIAERKRMSVKTIDMA